MVRYSSTIERDLLYFLEYWSAVTWYQEQPTTIEWQMADGQIRRYTPDYEIHEGDIKIIAECKPEAKLTSEHAQQQREIGEAWSEENGYHFVTYTDTELRAGHRLDNVKLFWRYARLQVLPVFQDPIFTIVNRHRTPYSLAGLCQQLNKTPQDVVPTVCHLLFHHRLQMDITQPFSIMTVVRLAEGGHDGKD
jgi:hypothetical protein